MSLAAPLHQSQLDAASRLYGRMKQWVDSNQALNALSGQWPDFDLDAVIIKVVAVNQLYGTNLYAAIRMARHIVVVVRDVTHNPGNVPVDDIELVERMAELPVVSDHERPKRFISFASKFAHFFIDGAKQFPIYDQYAVNMVGYHLGRANEVLHPTRPYWAFVKNLEKLRDLAHLTCTSDELDRYLWLAGLYLEWERDPEAKINSEARNLFEQPSPDVNVKRDLDELLPPHVPRPPRRRKRTP